jgi:hypothetical protein
MRGLKRIAMIEWAKVAPYGFVRTMIILLALVFFLVIFATSRIDISVPGFSWRNIYRFPYNWSSFAWVASWFNIFLSIIVITVTGNEFQHRTFRQQVMNGYDRSEWLAGKGILILFLALAGVVMVTLTVVIFGFAMTPDLTLKALFSGISVIPVYFLQATGYMVTGMLIVTLFRSNALSIILFFLYFIIIEPVIRVMSPAEIRPWFPVKIISHLTPPPEILQLASNAGEEASSALTFEGLGILPRQLPQNINLMMALLYISLFVTLTWVIIRKKDL